MRTVGQSVESLVQLPGLAPGADGDHREEPSLRSCFGAFDCAQKGAQLRERVVQDVG